MSGKEKKERPIVSFIDKGTKEYQDMVKEMSNKLYNTDMTSLDKNKRKQLEKEGYHVRWIRADDATNRAKKSALGYTIVEDNLNDPRMEEVQGKALSRITKRGDLVLAKIPSVMHDAIQQSKRERAEKMKKGATEEFREKIERLNRDLEKRFGHKGILMLNEDV